MAPDAAADTQVEVGVVSSSKDRPMQGVDEAEAVLGIYEEELISKNN